MPIENLTKARQILADHEKRYRNSATRWKFSYRFLLLLSALFSGTSAIVAKLTYYKVPGPEDTAAILAAAAAIITTVIAALDFESNTRVNRKSRHQVSVLLLELEKSNTNSDDVLTQLQKVIEQRSEELNRAD